jgi:hypothetical protein
MRRTSVWNCLSATIASAVLGSVLLLGASATPAYAIVGDCNTAYAVLYDGETRSTPNRMFCYGIVDRDIESEPGNVMGPLGDGNPVVYKDDFDSNGLSSGVSSIFIANGSSGTKTFCLYAGKDFSGSSHGMVIVNSGSRYETNLYAVEDVSGSFRILNGNVAC